MTDSLTALASATTRGRIERLLAGQTITQADADAIAEAAAARTGEADRLGVRVRSEPGSPFVFEIRASWPAHVAPDQIGGIPADVATVLQTALAALAARGFQVTP